MPDVSDSEELESQEDSAVLRELRAIRTQLDVLISLFLDQMSDEAFAFPRKVSHKTHRLKATRVKLRDGEIGRSVGSPAKDVNRRLSEYKSGDVIKRIKPRPKIGTGSSGSSGYSDD
jgi:hypothetical protein